MSEPKESMRSAVKSPFYEIPSKTTFFSVAFSMFGAGVLGGVYHTMRRESFKFDRRMHGTPFAVASKALLLGTALCFGSFAAGTAVLVTTTGITSFEEFGATLSKKLGTVEVLQPRDPEVVADLKAVRGMSEEVEMEHWWQRFFGDGPPTTSIPSSSPAATSAPASATKD